MRIAWLFPGQGSQEVSMGKSVYEASNAARAVFDAADAALDRPISKLCFEGPLEELTLTSNTQPALLATSIALLAAVREQVPSLPAPAFAAGHSLGEYSALVAAGALDFADAIRIVELRGRAMQNAVPEGRGGMVAIIGGERAAAIALCEDVRDAGSLEVANFNAPGQVVLSGEKAAVERAAVLAGERQLKAIVLKVSAPFHCSLMKPAADAVDAALANISIHPLEFPVVANAVAEPNREPSRVRQLLVSQIDGPVRWEESVRHMAEAGVTHALEIGSGKVLAGLVKRIDKRIRVHNVSSLDSIATIAAFLG
jgi:[acyl-carrier-protein] S-malonyltransferase